MDPVEDYLAERSKLSAAKHQADDQLFQQWKGRPNKRNLSSLLTQFDSEINKRIHLWAGGARKINEAALKSDLRGNAIAAFETFDPNRGAQLRTHVNNMLRRSQRFVGLYQNMAFIPEEKRQLITPIQRARDQLFQEKRCSDLFE